MPTICCDNRNCGYNQCYSCTCEHIRLTTEGGCTAFIPVEELERREIELRCNPYNVESPVLLLCRSNVASVAQELQAHGFQKVREPQYGLWGFAVIREPRAYVWSLQTNFDKLGIILEELKKDGYAVQDFITAEERSAWEKEKYYSGMSREEKAATLFNLRPPVLPEVVASGYWNGKLYGYPGKESVWVDGVQKKLNASQAEEIRTYIERKKQYDEQAGDLCRFA